MKIRSRSMRLTVVAALAGCSTGCATVIRGPNTNWNVETSPSGAEVATSTGRHCASTPCVIRVPRKSQFTATITKPGYQPATVTVAHDLSLPGALGFAGNLLIGGLIGMTVDYVSGATLDLTPNPSTIALERDVSAAALIAYVPSRAVSGPPPGPEPVFAASAQVPPGPAASPVAQGVQPRGLAGVRTRRVATDLGAVSYETYEPGAGNDRD